MKKRPVLIGFLAVTVLLIATIAGLGLVGVHPIAIWNFSSSMPEGLYVRAPMRALRDGDVVAVCLTDSAHQRFEQLAAARDYVWKDHFGGCAYGARRFAPLVKRIVAVPGQEVSISQAGIVVDGHLQATSVPLKADSAGRPLPHIEFSGRLPAGMYVVMGEDPLSYDSRYFGPIPRVDVLERLWRP